MTNFLSKYNLGTDGKKETTKEQQEAINNAIAKGKYLDIMRIIGTILEGNKGEDYITMPFITSKLRISDEVADIILQRLFDNGIIDSIESGKIVKTKDEFKEIMAKYLEENLSVIQIEPIK